MLSYEFYKIPSRDREHMANLQSQRNCGFEPKFHFYDFLSAQNPRFAENQSVINQAQCHRLCCPVAVRSITETAYQ